MTRVQRLLLALLALLGVVAAMLGVRIARTDRDARVELGRFKLTALEPATQERLARLTDRVLLTFYVSARDRLPSSMRTLERDATDLFETLRDGSGGRVDFQIVDPDSDPDLARFAAGRGIAPIRVRSVERDGYSEKTVWSGLTIAYGSHPPATINGLLPERLPRLQSLLVAELDQMETPRRPVIALAAPVGAAGNAGYEELALALSARGDVHRVNLDGGAPLPAGADLVCWMDAQRVDDARVREIELFLSSGRSLVIAGSTRKVALLASAPASSPGAPASSPGAPASSPGAPVSSPGAPVLEFPATHYAGGELLSAFGLFDVDGVVCDQWMGAWDGVAPPLQLPFFVRSIAPNQDFHTLIGQPNGSLLFEVPTPFRLDGARLAERGLSAELLASSSDGTWILPVPSAGLSVADMTPEHGASAPRQPLLVCLRPVDPWGGLLVAAAASSPFRDSLLHAPDYAHGALLDVLLASTVNDGRLVQSRVGLDRPAPLPELSAARRGLWRALAVLLFPALLAAWAALRTARSRRLAPVDAVRPAPWKRRAVLTGLGGVAVSLAVAGAARTTGARLDLSAAGLNDLSAETEKLARAATGAQAVTAELFFSPRERLPPALRPGLARLDDMLGELRRAGADLTVAVRLPELLDDAGRAALREQGIAPVDVATRDEDTTSVRSVWCSLRLAGGGRSTVLAFPEASAFESFEFRLAFALWRLQTGREPRVGFASDAPRLSAAEVHELYQKRGLIAPQGSDAYALARAALAGWDFRVEHINPREPALPADPDAPEGLAALVWLQPRRPVEGMLEQTVHYLHSGGRVLIAAQHFSVQSRQFPGNAFKLQYWPQPQTTDLETKYFPELGIELVREPFFDELKLSLPIASMVYEEGARETAAMDAALPFLVRVAAANHDGASAVTENLGDLAFPTPSRFRVDDARLAALGLTCRTLMTSSAHSWSLAWAGGSIPDELLAGAPRDENGNVVYRGRVPLAIEVVGQFPLPRERLAPTRSMLDAAGLPVDPQPLPPPYPPVDLPPARPGRLLFVGDSELFRNDRMPDATFRSDHLLLNAVAALALPPELAQVATRRVVARGFELLDPDARLSWRALVLGAFPAVAALLAVAWTLARRRPQRARARDGAGVGVAPRGGR